ncbi:XH/XS domain-containing protein [Artemisia annua]|uniref:XH/XS domain-containing protein n=1 Tax=Artemisia annua TaxID=35608 RepID=A0A2U1P983_ARTAN|nr:XH/XS domain-containing protein [Artemisia annua]
MEDNNVQCFSEKSGAGSSININGELFSQNDVRTVPEIIMEEKGPKATKLMSNLTNVIEVKKRRLEEMERKYMETKNTTSKLIAENDKLQQSYYKGSCVYLLFILKLQRQEKELELRSIELQKREVVNQKKRKRLAKEIEQTAAKNSLLQEQRKANESMMKLANDHMREKEKLHEKIIFLKKQLDGKQVIELRKEIECLKGQINDMKYRREYHFEDKKKIEDIRMKLEDQEEELEDLKCLNETLFDKQRINNIKLKETREELIQGLKELPQSGNIGVKMVVEYEFKPFYDTLIRWHYNETKSKDTALKLCLRWQVLLRDPNWRPFKVIYGNDIPQRNFHEEMYEGMMTTWRENNDYNYGGRFDRSELWNFTESRKATLKEGVSCLLKKWDAQKRRRRT